MSVFKQEDAAMWTSLFADVARDKPAVGRTVRVTRGKHHGKVGVVKKHQPSRYGNAFRYGNEASHAMTQARGRHGFAILIEQTGGETFWTDGDNVMVCFEN